MSSTALLWILFNAGVLLLLALDQVIRAGRKREASLAESVVTTLAWIGLSAAFGLWIGHSQGSDRAVEFFTGYLIEYALSMDNVFLFVLIFASFRVAHSQQQRLLFWGVLGAMLMRGIMVGVGTTLLSHFEWIIYIFGLYIVYAGATMLLPQKEIPVEQRRIVRWTRRILPLSSDPTPTRFIVHEDGRSKFTLLVLVLVTIELTDLIFAFDSVPAVFAVTRDPFIVYTSNICAILGLRSLYILLAHAITRLVYLHYGLAAILIFVGTKMVGERFYSVPTLLSLAVVGAILALTVVASLLRTAWAPKEASP